MIFVCWYVDVCGRTLVWTGVSIRIYKCLCACLYVRICACSKGTNKGTCIRRVWTDMSPSLMSPMLDDAMLLLQLLLYLFHPVLGSPLLLASELPLFFYTSSTPAIHSFLSPTFQCYMRACTTTTSWQHVQILAFNSIQINNLCNSLYTMLLCYGQSFIESRLIPIISNISLVIEF